MYFLTKLSKRLALNNTAIIRSYSCTWESQKLVVDGSIVVVGALTGCA